ncbi:SpoIIIAC/SpoIIIAD family protein [Massiliimalia massiliensis]|uniref:SpoIIIAC/SpoIIIAD family protein n=1 Tax=Massiliimalia massiliensis TaxID=1852384 RepID=UPI0009858DB7|nr:SpoIIIAC/SpoIIIAD family protein [Massiliimalia massiliensis]
MDIFPIVGIALVGAALCILFKQYKPEYAMLTALISGILLFGMILLNLEPVFQTVTEMMERVQVNSEYAKAVIKALGICYVVQLAADTCRDAGQSALAGKVELGGKAAVVVIALPLFQNLLNLALSLIDLP